MNENLETRVMKLPDEANALQVTDQALLTKANAFLLGIKSLRRQIDEAWDPVIEAAYKSHREALNQKQKFANPLLFAEQIIKKRIATYLALQERIRREGEEAKRRAEEERRRLEEEALRKAQEAEERARKAELEAIASLESEKRAKAEEEAIKARQEADEIMKKAADEENKIMVDSPIPDQPKTSGLTAKEDWKFKIIIPELIPREYLLPDLVKIGKFVRIMKSQANIPGIMVYPEKNISVRLR